LTNSTCACSHICRVLAEEKGGDAGDNLKKLIDTFDTIEDLVLALKRTSVKCGVEGAIALAQSSGEKVNWAKIGSSPARPLSEMLGFFKYAKKYAPNIVSLITPSMTSSTSAIGSLRPPALDSATAEHSAPSSAMEPTAEVA
jgi:hypothetical protein